NSAAARRNTTNCTRSSSSTASATAGRNRPAMDVRCLMVASLKMSRVSSEATLSISVCERNRADDKNRLEGCRLFPATWKPPSTVAVQGRGAGNRNLSVSEGQRFPCAAARSVEPVTERAERSSGRRVIERALGPRGAQGTRTAVRAASRSEWFWPLLPKQKWLAQPRSGGRNAFEKMDRIDSIWRKHVPPILSTLAILIQTSN